MSILIKGMAMPKNCAECEISQAYDIRSTWCPLTFSTQAELKRQDNCPLIEFPPHGKWIFYNAGFGFTHHCSNCNFEVKEQWIGFYNFCPSCGADMREKESE